MNDIGERLHGWTEKNLITVDALGLDGEDHEFLWEVSELGEAFASREEMKLEIQLASDKRISRLTAIGLLHDGGSRDHVPTVTPLGLLLV